jgi:hypothetical protein
VTQAELHEERVQNGTCVACEYHGSVHDAAAPDFEGRRGGAGGCCRGCGGGRASSAWLHACDVTQPQWL